MLPGGENEADGASLRWTSLTDIFKILEMIEPDEESDHAEDTARNREIGKITS